MDCRAKICFVYPIFGSIPKIGLLSEWVPIVCCLAGISIDFPLTGKIKNEYGNSFYNVCM